MLFRDRCDAGQKLAERLAFLKDEKDVIVLGIPRGGVVVAAEVARGLRAPLDVFIAHKIGAPFNPELAIGAITRNGHVLLDDEMLGAMDLSEQEIAREIAYQRAEMARRVEMFQRERAPLDVKNKIVIVIDDGIATGATMLVALRALTQQALARLILAVPVAPADSFARLARECDDAIALATPSPFWAVGRFYAQFEQTSDAEVIALLDDAARRGASSQ
ncbi:MAG: phosphoribosyltransferase [Chloroflexi bacterium]|nr:phosphoribosyltransferase [Chloroflexota bacterium]